MRDRLWSHSSEGFVPRGNCYAWDEGLISLHTLSDAILGISLFAIAATLVYPLYTSKSAFFRRPAAAFGALTVACGLTYFLDLLLIWRASYWLDAGVRVLAALAATCVVLIAPALVPRILELARGLNAARRRGVELAAAVESLEQMYETTKELERLKTQFFASIGQELRAPLTLVMGPAERLLHAQNLTLEQRRDAELTLRNCRAMLGQVDNLLDVSRLEAGKLQASYARCDLAGLLRRTAAHFDALASERGVSLVLETPESLWAEVDPALLQRVLLNLLANAFRFTPNAGQIRVSLKELEGEPRRARIEVADSGPAIRPELRGSIFERYQLPDVSQTRRLGGAGLGLSLARDLVALHAGSMDVADAPEGGAAFRAELPLCAPPQREVRAAVRDGISALALDSHRSVLDQLWIRERRGEAYLPPLRDKQRPLVLVVQPNPELNRLVCETLSVEYRTQSAFDGRAGLEKALRAVPDLVLMDLALPDMSGDQLVQAIRNSPELDDTPLLLLSGRADEPLRARLLREGAQDFVLAPFAGDELRARAGNLLSITRTRRVLRQESCSELYDLELLALTLAQQKRETHAALEALRSARVHAEEASRAKSHFLAQVSQALRELLGAAPSQLGMLSSSVPRDLAHDRPFSVAGTASGLDRIRALTDALLQYARIESGNFTLCTEVFDVGRMAAEVVAERRSAAAEKGLQLVLEVEPEAPRFEADRELVRLILLQLVENALQYSEQGAVRVAVGFDERAFRLTVADAGPGIPRDLQARVFRAYDAEGRCENVSGVGLGIALVRPMVEALGGSLTFRSRVGHGTQFSVRFPHRNSSAFESGLHVTAHA